MRDWHILTSGLLTYTADARFRVKHQSQPTSAVPSRPDVSEWTLEIKFLQQRDEGTYLCQVNNKFLSFDLPEGSPTIPVAPPTNANGL